MTIRLPNRIDIDSMFDTIPLLFEDLKLQILKRFKTPRSFTVPTCIVSQP